MSLDKLDSSNKLLTFAEEFEQIQNKSPKEVEIFVVEYLKKFSKQIKTNDGKDLEIYLKNIIDLEGCAVNDDGHWRSLFMYLEGNDRVLKEIGNCNNELTSYILDSYANSIPKSSGTSDNLVYEKESLDLFVKHNKIKKCLFTMFSNYNDNSNKSYENIEVASFWHDLRSQFNNIDGCIQFMDLHPNERKFDKEIDSAYIEIQNLLSVYKNSICLSDKDSLIRPIKMTTFDIHNTLHGLGERFYKEAKEKGKDFQLNETIDVNNIFIDSSLWIIIRDLVKNSCKALMISSEENCKLDVEITENKEKNLLMIMVSDNGDGIDITSILATAFQQFKDNPEVIEEVDPKVRKMIEAWGENEYIMREMSVGSVIDLAYLPRVTGFSKKYEGFSSGVGLNVVNQLVKGDSGEIMATNQAGSGAQFVIIAPLFPEDVDDDLRDKILGIREAILETGYDNVAVGF